ncbi:glycoside hydrolase family 19 protein [Variovorax sp. RT4R15]|uniref:glycoside hydrolase family 19 protein n=1 Tax=Variovorax sp. RT4R15 TaxID=3443737 RepID=UPI003F48CFD5
MDAQTLAKCTGATLQDAEVYAQPLTAAMDRFHIDTPKRQAAFLATIAIESMNLTKVEEGLYYKDAARLAKIYPRAFKSAADAEPFARNPQALGKLLYQGYWGRGFIQLTWEKNYRAAGDALGFDYINQPSLVLEPQHAALTAGWFWDDANCNAPADDGDMRGMTLRVNGKALMHLDERTAQFLKNVAVLS